MTLDNLTAPAARGEDSTLYSPKVDAAFNDMMALVKKTVEEDPKATSVNVLELGYRTIPIPGRESDDPKMLNYLEEESLVKALKDRWFDVTEKLNYIWNDTTLQVENKGSWVQTISWDR